ncbi:MAG: J domain-containing protein [Thermodesulfobacteriota bacterium]|nr:J domain-containing protein [Thermodesulfobacteriota bacterium]
MSLFAETDLFDACRVLFGAEVQVNRDFLYYIQPRGVKSAYRQKAKETHPDCLIGAAPHEYERQNELFRDVSQAYQLLDSFSSDEQNKLRFPADWDTSFDRQGWQKPTPRQEHSRPSSTNSTNYRSDQSESTASPFELPQRHLETGLFLYYRGVISYAEMIEALVWQRRQRPILGTIAEGWGWLKTGDVQAINRFRGRRGRFGARAVELGYLTAFQVQVLLRHQRQLQKRFGQYFVEQGMVSDGKIEAYIREQEQHNRRYRSQRP